MVIDHEIEIIFICRINNPYLSGCPDPGIHQRKPGNVSTRRVWILCANEIAESGLRINRYPGRKYK
jgi:hypothetical protein